MCHERWALHVVIKRKEFVTFIITTCSVERYWHCSNKAVNYISDETVNLCGLRRCATTSPITVFINFVFYIYSFSEKMTSDIHATYI